MTTNGSNHLLVSERTNLLCKTPLFPSNPISPHSTPEDVLTPCMLHALFPSIAMLVAAISTAWLLVIHGCLGSKINDIKRPIRLWAVLPMAKIIISGLDLFIAHIFMALHDASLRETNVEALANVLFSAFATLSYLACIRMRIPTYIALHFSWLIRTLSLLPIVMMALMTYNKDDEFEHSKTYFLNIFYLIHFFFALAMLVLLCWPDPLYHSRRAHESDSKGGKHQVVYISLVKENEEVVAGVVHDRRKSHPEMRCSSISALLFCYASRMIKLAVQSGLDLEHLWPMEKRNQAIMLSDQLFLARPHKWTPFSLIRTLFVCIWEWLLDACFYISIYCICRFVNVLFLGIVVQSVYAGHPFWLIMFALAGLFGLDMVGKICWQRAEYNAYIGGHCNVLGLMTVLIYDKMMRFSAAARGRYSAGEIQNMLTTDVGWMKDWFFSFYDYIYCPTMIVISMVGLYSQLGWSATFALAIVVAMLPTNYLFAKLLSHYQMRLITLIGQRLELVTDVLSGMKTLKLNAWEPCFEKRIADIRRDECNAWRTLFVIGYIQEVSMKLCPILATIVALFGYTIIQGQRMSPDVAFMSLLFIGMLRYSVSEAPNLVTKALKAWITAKRFCEFLNEEELQPSHIIRQNTVATVKALDFKQIVSIRDCTFAWDQTKKEEIFEQNNIEKAVIKSSEAEEIPLQNSNNEAKTEQFQLKSINLEINRGDLVAVVGKTGSGKSSLLLAILGEMNHLSEPTSSTEYTVQARSIGYVPQQAWIENKTLRQNILLDSDDPLDEQKYVDVLEACALDEDLKAIPAGDQIQLGDKGANLSGGQKSRVGLARAVYRNTELYLLDDPLANVDAQVAKHLFQKVIGKDGLLKSRSRIMALNTLAFLPNFDRIYVLDEGQIVASGTLNELKELSEGPFVELMRQYVQENAESAKEEGKDGKVGKAPQEEMEQMLNQIKGSPLARSLEAQINALVFAIRWRNKFAAGRKLKWGAKKKDIEDKGENIKADEKEIEKVAPLEEKKQDEEKEGQLAVDQTGNDEGEQIATGKISRQLYLDYFRAMGLALALVYLCFTLLSTLFGALANWWLANWTASIEQQNEQTENDTDIEKIRQKNLGDMAVYIFFNTFCLIAMLLAGILSSFGIAQAGFRIHNKLAHSLLRSPMAFFERIPIGQIINRVSQDIERLDFSIPACITTLIFLCGDAITFLLAICIVIPWFVLVLVPLSVIFMRIVHYFNAAAVHFSRLSSKSKSALYNNVLGAYQGAESIRAYNLLERYRFQTCRALDISNESYSAEIITNRWLQIRLDMLAEVAIFICVFATTLLASKGIVTISSLAMVIGVGFTFMSYLGYIARQWRQCESEMVGMERIKEYIENRQECKWHLDWNREGKKWPSEGRIEFRGVHIRYRPELEPALIGLSFEVQPGEKIGIVGRTASGKSSIIAALFRLVEPYGGEILIDGENIQQMGLHDLRKALAIIPQDPTLFCGTLRSNLDPLAQVDDDQLWSMLDKVGLNEFVRSKDEKLLFPIIDGGSNLSLGQRQLFCLARALLNADQTKILILDEPTSALDAETDARIQQVIKQNFFHCSILTITHKIQTVMESDRVLVMDKGKAVEFGAPKALLAETNGVFRQLAKDAGISMD